jgi:ribonuclease E
MTFYEAAIRVLEAEKRPLTTQEITERCIAQGLLSHVGKNPEETVRSRLGVMARRQRDRRVTVVGPDTFALVEWGLPEDAEAAAQTGQAEELPPLEEGAPLRSVERHPGLRSEGRAGGRADRKRHREEEDRGRGRRRLPPLEEVAFELLSEATEALSPAALLELAVSRELASTEMGPEKLLLALVSENQRRIDAGRRPHFALSQEGTLSLDRSETPPADIQAPFATALTLPVEDGRVVLGVAERAESGPEASAVSSARVAVREARRASARALRSQLSALDAGTFERACIKMLHAQGFRELKVNRRGKEGPLISARRRDGSLELRYVIRVLRGAGGVERRAVQECRREIGHASAHLGLLLASGDARGEARSEALGQSPLVLLWCGEGLADKFLESHSGARVLHAELFEVDPAFFQAAARVAAEVRERRAERRRERAEQAEPAEAVEAAGEEGPGGEGDSVEAPSAGGEGEGGGERKRRRRRRRGRRGRGGRPGEGAPAPGATEAAPSGASAPATEGGAPVEAPAAPPGGAGGEGVQ